MPLDSRISILSAVLIAVAACSQPAPPGERPRESNTPATLDLPPIGLAVSDDARNWCAAFVKSPGAAALGPGRRVTLVLAEGPVVAIDATIDNAQEEQCPAAFPQPRWIDYQAYRLTVIDLGGVTASTVALAVASDEPWTRAANGRPRADLERDGNPEEVMKCAADEGEHFTVWSVEPSGVRRRWHEYFDWGGLVDPTCKPGEDGQ